MYYYYTIFTQINKYLFILSFNYMLLKNYNKISSIQDQVMHIFFSLMSFELILNLSFKDT